MNIDQNAMEQYGPKKGDTCGEPCLILIGGRSGCGKTTVVEHLITEFPSVYTRVLSFTSRARRMGECNAEYEFVTREALHAKHSQGKLISLDKAYGEYYGMCRRTLETNLDRGQFVVKEMHVKNHAKVLAKMPATISVLLHLAEERWSDERHDFDRTRADRLAEDAAYYSALDLVRFQVVHSIEVGETPNKTAEALHAKIQEVAGRRHRDVMVRGVNGE